MSRAPVEIYIDEREQKLKDILANIPRKMLEIGDVQIGNFIVFERKTLQDLASSIKDGRYLNQKNMLLSHKDKFQRIAYIIEGIHDWTSEGFKRAYFNGIPGTTIVSCVINMIMRDGIHVIFSKSLLETAMIINEFYVRINSDPEKYIFNNTASDTSGNDVVIVKNKKLSAYMRILCQIPGVSTKTAEKISNIYPSIQILMKTLSPLTMDERKNKLLSEKIQKNVVEEILNIFFAA